jgi:hypothetical protein
MTDLIEKFFREDLTEAEEKTLSEQLLHSEEAGGRFGALSEQKYMSPMVCRNRCGMGRATEGGFLKNLGPLPSPYCWRVDHFRGHRLGDALLCTPAGDRGSPEWLPRHLSKRSRRLKADFSLEALLRPSRFKKSSGKIVEAPPTPVMTDTCARQGQRPPDRFPHVDGRTGCYSGSRA